jgi:fibronectin-binding autotransporter adhesin
MKRSVFLTWGTCLVLAIVANFDISTAQADDDFWTAGTGDFNNGSNWSLATPPTFFDDAYIDNGGTANYSTGTLVTGGLLSLGLDGDESGTLNVTGGSLEPSQMFIGQRGTGTVTVNGGGLRVGGASLFIGGNEGSGAQTGVGVLNVMGGPSSIVTSGDDFQLGASGTGTLNMSGGYARGSYTVVGKFGTGTWNHSGGVYDQNGGDIEIGDGGQPGQAGTPGPRTGTINLTGGVIRVAGHMGIGNRKGTGTVSVSGGALSLSGSGDSTLYVGRGMDWGANQGGPTTLRVTGDDAIIIANGDLNMNTSLVSTSSTLVAEITGPTHTAIKVGGNALLTNGNFKVELNGYSPVSGDSWSIIQAGADLTADKAAIDAIVSGGGYPALTHVAPGTLGAVTGPFLSTDFSLASLTAGLSWNLAYTATEVVLSVTGTAVSNGDYDHDGDVDGRDFLIWQRGGSPSPLSSGDLAAWQSNYGGGGPLVASVSAVPEPSALLLFVLGTLVGIGRARGYRG